MDEVSTKLSSYSKAQSTIYDDDIGSGLGEPVITTNIT